MRPVVTELADGVFHVGRPGTNWQLLVEGDAVTLADAAWPRDLRLVAESLETIARRPEDVAVILLTHAHRDHLGTAAEVHRRYGTPVTSHVDEVPSARGEVTVAVLFTTDPAIVSDDLVTLADNITALVQTAIVTRWSEGSTKLTDAVSGQSTTAGLGDLNARVAGGAERDVVAARWLHGQGLA
jgi:glyoxylase-like metal-dependent hydrolase (beta-lactamase superfamily II)